MFHSLLSCPPPQTAALLRTYFVHFDSKIHEKYSYKTGTRFVSLKTNLASQIRASEGPTKAKTAIPAHFLRHKPVQNYCVAFFKSFSRTFCSTLTINELHWKIQKGHCILRAENTHRRSSRCSSASSLRLRLNTKVCVCVGGGLEGNLPPRVGGKFPSNPQPPPPAPASVSHGKNNTRRRGSQQHKPTWLVISVDDGTQVT